MPEERNVGNKDGLEKCMFGGSAMLMHISNRPHDAVVRVTTYLHEQQREERTLKERDRRRSYTRSGRFFHQMQRESFPRVRAYRSVYHRRRGNSEGEPSAELTQ